MEGRWREQQCAVSTQALEIGRARDQILAWPASRLFYSQLVLTTCFRDAGGLQAGAEVRIAGVQVGRIRKVRAQPENHDCPAFIEMALTTPYELKVPGDSITTTQTTGVLGGTYLEIDSSGASGPPVRSGAELKSRQAERVTPGQWLGMLDKNLEKLDRRVETLDKNSSKEPCRARNKVTGAQANKP
ncbi:MAG: hypothetical protein DMG71_20745 [Acidobacteria bacterium]|nr:MAG: hypothetical protein DMG71_20745 [Acidobacteriota bacterium]